jgi:hypothetical protein
MASLTTISDILKNQYLGPIRDQINSKTALLKRIGTDSESVVGTNFTIPLHVSRNQGVGARGELAALPSAGSQGYKAAIVPSKYNYARIQLSGPSIKASRSNEGAFARALDSEMKGAANDAKSSMNRQLFGDGSGILTLCGTTAASTTVTVASTAKLQVGMPIDVLVKADGTTGTGAVDRTVSSIASATTFVISGAAITTDATYAVYVHDSRNKEVMGLAGIVSDADPAGGALQNLAVATYPWWKAGKSTNGGTPRAITETMFQTAIDYVDANSNGGCSVIYTSYGVRRAYQNLLKADMQYVNVKTLDGGVDALLYSGKPIMVDKDCQASTLYFLDEDSLKFYQLADWDWMNEDGAVLSRVSGVDAYEAVLYKYAELGCSMRNANYLLGDITEA